MNILGILISKWIEIQIYYGIKPYRLTNTLREETFDILRVSTLIFVRLYRPDLLFS